MPTCVSPGAVQRRLRPICSVQPQCSLSAASVQPAWAQPGRTESLRLRRDAFSCRQGSRLVLILVSALVRILELCPPAWGTTCCDSCALRTARGVLVARAHLLREARLRAAPERPSEGPDPGGRSAGCQPAFRQARSSDVCDLIIIILLLLSLLLLLLLLLSLID